MPQFKYIARSRTGEKIEKPATTVVKFRVATSLKKQVA